MVNNLLCGGVGRTSIILRWATSGILVPISTYRYKSSSEKQLLHVLNPFGDRPIACDRLCSGDGGAATGTALLIAAATPRMTATAGTAAAVAAGYGRVAEGTRPVDGREAARLGGAEGAAAAAAAAGVVLRTHDEGEVAAAAAAALEVQRGWSRRPMRERLEVVGHFGGLLEAGEGLEVAKALCEETGKPLRQARAEVRLAAARVRQILSTLRQLPYSLSGDAVANPGDVAGGGGQRRRRREFVEWEPVGVVASITAWNFPVVLSCDLASPALALGNAVLAKPSEHAALVGLALEVLWRRAGLPQVGAVFLTGSRAAGRAVLAAVARREVPVPVHLELGGKDVVYVHDDVVTAAAAAAAVVLQPGGPVASAAAAAPAAATVGGSGGREQGVSAANATGGGGGDGGMGALRRVAVAVADAAFANSGQVCCAPKIAYVAQPLAHPFAQLVSERVTALRAGDPSSPSLDVDLGPLVLPGAAQRLRELVAEALAAGAIDVVQEVLQRAGGREDVNVTASGNGSATRTSLPSNPAAAPSSASARAGAAPRPRDGWATWSAAEAASGGAFFAPRVLWDAPRDSRVVTEEVFGPVLCVQPVASAAEAAALMSRSRYGLTAACYSRDEAVAVALLRAADVGTVYWNACGEMPVGLPWSGRRWSGLGVQLGGAEGFKSLLRPKSHVFNDLFAAAG